MKIIEFIALIALKMHSIRIPRILIIAGILGFIFLQYYNLYRMDKGREVDISDYSSFLSQKLSDDFGYSKFNNSWLKNAWVSGFLDHTYLFVISEDTGELRKAIEEVTKNDPIQLAYFQGGMYLGDSKAPDWWDVIKIDSSESLYYERYSNFWRFTWIGDRLYVVYLTT